MEFAFGDISNQEYLCLREYKIITTAPLTTLGGGERSWACVSATTCINLYVDEAIIPQDCTPTAASPPS